MSAIASSDVLNQVEKLVEEHKKIEDETLLLAVYYKPDRDPNDIFLFEVIDDFGSGSIDSDKELFEVAFASTSSFPIENGGHLHLLLTNPQEFAVACDQQWPLMEEVRRAVQSGRAQTIYSDPSRPDLEAKLRG